MKRPRPNLHRPGTLAALLALFLLAGAAVHAQTGGGYDLTWNTLDGGGATFSTGGDYQLGGTLGQPEAGQLSGGGYALSGGFWVGGGEAVGVGYDIYLPSILRVSP
jgi:hypothetical protein